MSIGRAWRVGGFVTALAASVGLVEAATSATGAYFTDSHAGTFQATSGHLTLSVSASQMALNFTNLIPAVDQTKTIGYKTSSSPGLNEDIWLVFPQDTYAQRLAYAEFTGSTANATYSGGGMGRYGHFAVADSHGGLAFQSYNLANAPTAAGPVCSVDANGRGGSNQPAASPGDTSMGYCGVPKMIKLADNLSNGTSGTITVTFGLTGRQTQQNQMEFLKPAVTGTANPVQYEIVATQHGVRPDALNF